VTLVVENRVALPSDDEVEIEEVEVTEE